MASNLTSLIVVTGVAMAFGAALGSSSTQKVDSSKLKEIPDRVQAFVGKEVAGAVTLVETRDKVLALDAVGEANLQSHTPMRADAVFWIASMTKPVTATAVMILQQEGKLSVDDPVGKYLPELAHLKTKDGREPVVTLKHLLTHTSGLAEPTHGQSRAARSLADLIPHFAERPLEFEPGSKWQYCQSGINTLGRVVEVVSGEAFPDFLSKRLFGPLGMKDTSFYPAHEQIERLASSYKVSNGKFELAHPFLPESADPSSHDHYPAPNGGLYSTATDYGRFLQMILNDGTVDGHQYLTAASIKKMTAVQSGSLATGFTPGNGWGLGWCVVREPQGVTEALSPGSFGHGGAYGTQAWVDPVKGVAYILMVQRANFPNSDASELRKAFQDTAAAAFPN